MSGKVIVIEGKDGSGKATQTELLYQTLEERGMKVIVTSFPNYNSLSSGPVRKFLGGEFAHDRKKSNLSLQHLLRVSMCYAVDRAATFMEAIHGPEGNQSLFDLYEEGYIILADRYSTANILHQCSQLYDPNDIVASQAKMDLLYHTLINQEYKILGLPQPNKVIYLDVNVNLTLENMRKRYQNGKDPQHYTETEEYVIQTDAASKYIVDTFGWDTIKCDDGREMRSIGDIRNDIWEHVKPVIE